MLTCGQAKQQAKLHNVPHMRHAPDRPLADEQASTRAQRAFLALCVVIVGGFLCLGAYLSYDALRTNGREIVRSRFELSAQRVALAAQRAMSTGLELSTQTTLPALLRRAMDQDPAIISFDVVDARGVVLFSADAQRTGQPGVEADDNVVRHDLLDDLGQRQGAVQVRFGHTLLSDLDQRFAQGMKAGLPLPLGMACLVLVLGGGWLIRLSRTVCNSPQQAGPVRWGVLLRPGFRASLSLLAGTVLAGTLVALHGHASQMAQQTLPPEMRAKAQSVARASSAQIALAVDTGVPLSQLRGVEPHFDALLKSGPEIAALALFNVDGQVLARRGATTFSGADYAVAEPVVVQGQTVAEVRVAIDDSVLQSRLRANALDTGFLAVVVLLMANELMALLGTLTLSRHLIALDRQLEQRLKPDDGSSLSGASPAANAIRPVLFLFMMGEELIRPFLPNHARSLVPQGLENMTSWGSLPLVVFLVVVALCQLPFASLSVRMGRRKGLMWGAGLAAVGYALSGWTTDFWVFTVARVLSGLGFALVFVSSQGAVVDGSDGSNRSPSLAVFVRAILVAGLCGPPLGGLLADRLGVPAVFALGALLCVLAVALAYHALAVPMASRTAGQPADLATEDASALGSLPAVWRSRGLRGLILGAAVPAKLMLAATCFYLVPIGLAQQGYSSAEIGRFLMIYPLLMVVGVGPMAAWARRLNRQSAFVVGGGLLAGVGGLLGLAPLTDTTVIALLVLLGVGQAMSITSQTDLVINMAQRVHGLSASQVLGLFRTLERGGSALGPAVGAWLLGTLGLGPAIAATGGLVIAGNMLYTWHARHDPHNA